MRGKKPGAVALLAAHKKAKEAAEHRIKETMDDPLAPVSPETPPPVDLDDVGQKIWNQHIKELALSGFVTALDLPIFRIYCASYAHMLEAERILEEDGVLCKTKTGDWKKHPAATLKNEAYARVMKTATELGITPASRRTVIPVSRTPGSRWSRKNEFDDV